MLNSLKWNTGTTQKNKKQKQWRNEDKQETEHEIFCTSYMVAFLYSCPSWIVDFLLTREFCVRMECKK